MRIRTVFVFVALFFYCLDLGTKLLAVATLTDHPDVPVVGDVLVLHLTRNAGAAFSTGTEYTVILSCVAVLAVLVVLQVARRAGSVLWAVALGLLFAGVSGNLTDRLFRSPGPLRGHVVDFLMLPNWPVFNVADMCINVAAGLILLQAFRGVRLNGTRPEHDKSGTAGDRA
jgi:signal peptidase II